MLKSKKTKRLLFLLIFFKILNITYSQCKLNYVVSFDTITEKQLDDKIYLPENSKKIESRERENKKLTQFYFFDGFNNDVISVIAYKKVVIKEKIRTNLNGYAKKKKINRLRSNDFISIKMNDCITDNIPVKKSCNYIYINYDIETKMLHIKISDKEVYFD
jgi:hypothetical protein